MRKKLVLISNAWRIPLIMLFSLLLSWTTGYFSKDEYRSFDERRYFPLGILPLRSKPFLSISNVGKWEEGVQLDATLETKL